LSAVLAASFPALASEYPRRVAVAPFASLTKEDIGTTVAVLPRLISSRLMALAGADVLLLNADKPAADAARDAKYPLLLEGTVAKLGKGYSIDVVLIDLAEGKNAGAFFTTAATEDDIILQLGVLSGEIAEKVFGVQGAVRAVSPPPVVVAPAWGPPAAASVAAAAAPPQGTTAEPPAASTPSVSVPVRTTLATGWLPSSIKKTGQSSVIPDELNGIVAVQIDDEGNGLVAAYSKTVIYMYRINGDEVLPYTRIRRSLNYHIVSVDAFDIDGDGEKEILVTGLLDESLQSFILKKKGDNYEEIAERIRYYLAVLPDWKGKPTLVGQHQGVDTPFRGKVVALNWDGKRLVPGEVFPHNTAINPMIGGGTLGLSSGNFGNDWRLVYTDSESFLRVLDSDGKTIYRSRGRYGARFDFFEWGPYIVADGRRKRYTIRNPARLAPGSGEAPLVLTTEMTKGLLDLVGGSYDSTRVVLLSWEGSEFLERAGTQGSSLFLSGADFLSRSGFSKGDRVIVSVIEQSGMFFKEQLSRVVLYQVE